jgi:Alba
MARKSRKRKASTVSDSPQQNKRQKPPGKSVDTIEIDSSIDQFENETATPNEERPERRAPGQIRSPPPILPPSVNAMHPLLPPYGDDVALRKAFNIHVVHVTASSKMESKVRQVLSLLKAASDSKSKDSEPKPNSNRSVLVALVARAPAANKCISIAEIAKREFHKMEQKKWYQYTGYWVRLEEMKVKEKQKDSPIMARDSGISDVEMETDQDDAFESATEGSRQKVRNIPCLFIYLSTIPVARLQSTYA